MSVPIDTEAKQVLLAVMTLMDEGDYPAIHALLRDEPIHVLAVVATYLAAGWAHDRKQLVKLPQVESLLEQVQRVALQHTMGDRS